MRCWFLPLLDAMAWGLARLPQWLLLALGRGAAWLLWPLLRSRRRVARINIDLCFPELDADARRRLADASVVDTVIGVFEMIRAWHAPAAVIRAIGEVEGLPILRSALARGGVMLTGAHFTHFELGVRLLSEALGRPVRELVRPHNHPCVHAWIDRSRAARFGPTIAKKDRAGLLRALQDGHPVMYLGDQNFSYRNVFVPFFGVPAATLAAMPQIAAEGGATVVPFRVHRGADGRYVVTVEPAWDGWPSGDPAQDATTYMAFVERAVRAFPSQYLWVHKRFKTRPPGEPPIY